MRTTARAVDELRQERAVHEEDGVLSAGRAQGGRVAEACPRRWGPRRARGSTSRTRRCGPCAGCSAKARRVELTEDGGGGVVDLRHEERARRGPARGRTSAARSPGGEDLARSSYVERDRRPRDVGEEHHRQRRESGPRPRSALPASASPRGSRGRRSATASRSTPHQQEHEEKAVVAHVPAVDETEECHQPEQARG